MSRILFNDYIDATLAALFVTVVVAMLVYGVIGVQRAAANPNITAREVQPVGAAPGLGDD